MRNKVVAMVLLLIIPLSISAKKVDGFIIAKDGNKIYGQIRLTSVHYPSGAISINNINYTPLYVSVFFQEKGTKRFKEYYPEDIDGYSFFYDDQQIYFFSIGLPFNEWGRTKIKKKFLRLVEAGHLILFDSQTLIRMGYEYSEFTDYYISDNKNNISNLANNPYSNLEEYLVKHIKIEREFLRNQPYKIHIRNIKRIIRSYNNWKKQQINSTVNESKNNF